MSSSKLEIPKITISYKNFSITVDPIELHSGEILGLFGKSGAGKTSYMKRVREYFDAPRAHYMSQFDSLLEEVTVRQNIELALTCSGKTKEQVRHWESEYASMLKEFEVSKFMSKYPRQLSGGQRKRVELARFLMMDPEVLLLDEPFVGIGHLFESVATKYIIARAQSKRGGTIIVSHDFDLLCKFSERVMLVDDRGVIGFVPVNDPAWKPQDVRTAWTLGVENIIQTALVSQFQVAPEMLHQNPSLGSFISFWGWKAQWGLGAGGHASQLIFRIPRDHIESARTYLLHGTLYTQVLVRMDGTSESVSLVGKGEIRAGEEVVLGIGDVSFLKDNSKE